MNGSVRAGVTRPPKSFSDFADRHPDVARAYDELARCIREAGPLSDREVALVKLAISIGARMEGATFAHARKALAQGLDGDALHHVALLSCPTIGFPNMMAARGWIRDVLAKQ